MRLFVFAVGTTYLYSTLGSTGWFTIPVSKADSPRQSSTDSGEPSSKGETTGLVKRWINDSRPGEPESREKSYVPDKSGQQAPPSQSRVVKGGVESSVVDHVEMPNAPTHALQE